MQNNEINLDKEILEENENVSLKDFDIKKKRERWLKYKKLNNIFLIVAVILLFLLYIFYSILFYYKAFFRGKEYTEGFDGYSYTVGKFVKQNILDYFLSNQSNSTVNLDLLKISYKSKDTEFEKEIKDFLNSQNSYIEKKQILTQQVNSLLNKVKTIKSTISKLINDISNYAFLPEQVDRLIKGGDITNILYVVDGLKIMSLMSLYKYIPSYMQEFIKGPGKGFFKEKSLNCKELELVRKINYYVSRGDKDIKNFLKMCYLNPYEENWMKCYNGEFDYYYNYVLKIGKKFDTKFFKNLVAFVISKLESNNYSNIQINFNSLDPKTRQVAFSTIIRTYQENLSGMNFLILNDGSCLSRDLDIDNLYGGVNNLKKIISNLHVYLIITYLNFLRQSRMIEGDNIKINQLKVNMKKDKEGNIYNESNFSFKVKVQPEIVREIYDFIYSTK